MKRAILVTSGTLAGLVAVLTYSGADVPAAIAAGPADSAALGGPPPLDGSTDPSTSATPDAGSPSPSAAAPSGAPTKAAAAPTKAAAAPTTTAAGTKTAAATPTKAAPAPTKAAPKPTPTPTPTPTKAASVAKDYTGSLITHKYGKVQVGIRVKDGKIIAVWPAVFPNGASQPYSDFSIPVLKSETMRAQGAGIANVSGATRTWQAWKSSLTSAMHKAGI